MRLDHLLSKENILLVCFVAGWVLVSAWLVTSFRHCFVSGLGAKWWRFLFSGGTSPARGFCACGGSVKQR